MLRIHSFVHGRTGAHGKMHKCRLIHSYEIVYLSVEELGICPFLSLVLFFNPPVVKYQISG